LQISWVLIGLNPAQKTKYAHVWPQNTQKMKYRKKRMTIAFAVDTDAGQVSILGLYYGGQDYETILQEATRSWGV
jgi:hypothetical protein